jgi:DNA-binding transcriptional LysR family regulator
MNVNDTKHSIFEYQGSDEMIDQIEGRCVKTFIAVLEHKSLSKAAEALGYVQSTVTNHIQALERACDKKLFHRLPRGVEATEAGIEFSHYAYQFLQLGTALSEAMNAHALPRGTVKVRVLESFCVTYMPAVFAPFFEQYPDVKLDLSTGFFRETLDALLDRRIDLGIVPHDPNREDVLFHPLLEEELVFIATPSLAKQFLNSANKLEERVIGFGNRCIYQSMAYEVLEELGIQKYSSLEYASLEMIKQTVMNGMGIALVPRINVESELQANKLTLLPIQKKVAVTHGMIELKGRESTAAIRAVKQSFIQHFKQK